MAAPLHAERAAVRHGKPHETTEEHASCNCKNMIESQENTEKLDASLYPSQSFAGTKRENKSTIGYAADCAARGSLLAAILFPRRK